MSYRWVVFVGFVKTDGVQPKYATSVVNRNRNGTTKKTNREMIKKWKQNI